ARLSAAGDPTAPSYKSIACRCHWLHFLAELFLRYWPRAAVQLTDLQEMARQLHKSLLIPEKWPGRPGARSEIPKLFSKYYTTVSQYLNSIHRIHTSRRREKNAENSGTSLLHRVTTLGKAYGFVRISRSFSPRFFRLVRRRSGPAIA